MHPSSFGNRLKIVSTIISIKKSQDIKTELIILNILTNAKTKKISRFILRKKHWLLKNQKGFLKKARKNNEILVYLCFDTKKLV